ncbi:MBL fold metallo-hydrolase [Leptothoe sp. PORK10 BA2]|uniref:MBL fold metallo-hydrolase n=1 Tax=Leptothoe sp. PORK10 BA2 TaxID=3110254 RepID=UPI002B21B738|nr:MBL fold metallo-hydrolase [Leptothoe sp. PORK10 BA2]MEA5462757.1 MBL fold metallo-hydrolase [Leptothoe sp. PORK10 BA2]
MSTSETTPDSSSPATSGTTPANPANPSAPKLPQPVFDIDPTLYAFSPNRETLGGTAYLITYIAASADNALERHNILVDCPAWTDTNLDFIAQQGGIRWLVITHRGGSSRVRDWQSRFDCDVVVQEQEAYLLPQIKTHPFHRELVLTPHHRLLWAPGHSPGATCLYSSTHGGILFTGRHILPTRQGGAAPLRVSKTFHWPRQLQQIQRLLDEFTPQTLGYICPGANTGFLRGKRYIEQAYEKLTHLDLQVMAKSQALL